MQREAPDLHWVRHPEPRLHRPPADPRAHPAAGARGIAVLDLGRIGRRRPAASAVRHCHADKRIGATLSTDHPDFDRFALDCRMARGLGADLVVLHLWELPDGDRYLDRNLAHLPTLLDIADNHGVVLTVETIPCTAGNPIDNVRRACERDARCRATLDTEFLAAHDQLDRAYELRDVVAHVHVKDFHPAVWNTKPRRYLLPGEGVLDLEGFLDRLDWSGTVTLEMSAVRDDGSIDDDRLETAVAWLRRLSA